MPETIKVKLPDGSEKEVPRGTTPLDVARSISPRLADAALVARVRPLNGAKAPQDGRGQLVDLARPLESDAEVRILTEKDPEALEVYRHSTAHLLAAAVLDLFPETKLGIGPPIERGFYYDFDRPTPFTADDLVKIEKKMAEIRDRDLRYERIWTKKDEG